MTLEKNNLENNYASLFDRVKAATIDGIIVICFMYVATDIFSYFEDIHEGFKVVAFVLIFIVYEPFLVSRVGGTIGHSISKINVRESGIEEKKLSFIKALIRYVLKILLGWLSLLTVTNNAKKQALHDAAVNSIVVKNIEENV